MYQITTDLKKTTSEAEHQIFIDALQQLPAVEDAEVMWSKVNIKKNAMAWCNPIYCAPFPCDPKYCVPKLCRPNNRR